MSSQVEYRCFVGGLGLTTGDYDLKGAFQQLGEVIDSKIINDRETSRSRGFGFMTFKNKKSMRDAIKEMNGKELDGCNITVNEAQSSEYGGGGDGSGVSGYSRGGGHERQGFHYFRPYDGGGGGGSGFGGYEKSPGWRGF